MSDIFRTATAATLALVVSGCAGQPKIAFEPLTLDDAVVTAGPQRMAVPQPQIDILFDAPSEVVAEAPLTDMDLAALVEERSVAATMPAQPLGQFAETVFGQVLGVPYILGPGVAQRRDLISMSGPQEMSARQFLRLAEKALNQYGLVLTYQSGAVVVREGAQQPMHSGQAPGGAVQLKHLTALRTVAAGPAAGLVADIIQDKVPVSIEPAADVNGIVLVGDERAVAEARGLIDGLDRPEYVGMRVARIAPVLWSAESLAAMLREVLAGEGFQVGLGGAGAGTNLLYLAKPDCLLLFSDDARLFNRVMYWVKQLDSLDGAGGDHAGYFVYNVRNTTAAELGGLVARTSGGLDVGSGAPSAGRLDENAASAGRRMANGSGAAGVTLAGGSGPEGGGQSGQIVIDNPGNRILFRGTRREYAQVLRLLNELDVPAKQVLVEITIAEVALTDETRFGVEWFFDRQLTNGSIQATSVGGSVREPGGLGITFARGFSQTSVTAALNAIATNQNLNILSTPRLLARSGGQAQILIGNDVPIITSQRAADIQSSGDTDILQTVQYRQTGVILNIRPVVLTDERIDIEIFQEVSSQQPNVTSAIGSPVISNRSITTRLTLRAGMTAVLGGMIQDSQSMGQRGVPFMKDIPLIGRAFRTDSATKRKTELLILVTPRVIGEDRALQDVTAVFGRSLNSLMNGRGQTTFTLMPWIPGSRVPAHEHYRTQK